MQVSKSIFDDMKEQPAPIYKDVLEKHFGNFRRFGLTTI